jgi:biopolymer transport protein ExbB
MWVILACSLVAAAIFLERFFHLHRAQIRSSDFLKGIYNILRRRNIVEAISICEETPGPVAHIVRAAILHYDESEENIRKAVQDAGVQEIPRLESNLNLLSTLAQIMPLLGLLGTVLGMMQTLMAIQNNAPLVHSGDLAAGLWQALISTAAGLAVAIPAYVGYNFLAGRVESILVDMERAAAEILNFLRQQDRQVNLQFYEPAATSGN